MGLTVFAVSSLQSVGRVHARLGLFFDQVKEAYEKVGNAQTAFAEQDFDTSAANFADAQELLQATRQELSVALASSEYILSAVDVTGTVNSGRQLLVAGESLAQAGVSVSHALSILEDAKVTPAEGGATLVDTIEAALPELGAARESLARANTALEEVSPEAVPESLRESVVTLQSAVPRILDPLDSFMSQSSLLLSILGADQARDYLLLFQNHHELRPTGGFIGSVGLVNVDRGAVENIAVSTVYDPDGQLKEFIAPPEPLRMITNRWYLRDSNWFAEFPFSAAKAAQFFEKEGGPTVDGVIALTPRVIQNLLEITGPIELPAYDVTVTADNFIHLTQEQVTYDYDRELNKPKQFLADLAPLLLSRVFATESDQALGTLAALSRSAAEKDLLVYFRNGDEQAQVVNAGWGGTLPRDEPGFLNVVTANIGGHKSDQFVTQEIDYRAEVNTDGDLEAVVTIRRTHHGPTEALPFEYPEGENPAFKPNVVYQRVLVPNGAELLEARGFTPVATVPRLVEPEVLPELTADPQLAEWQRQQVAGQEGTAIGQEAGYASFGNWLVTEPGGTSVALYRYRIPDHFALPNVAIAARRVSLFVAKQPGDVRSTLRAELTLPSNVGIVHTVPHDGTTQDSAQHLVYRGDLTGDRLVGAVIERR